MKNVFIFLAGAGIGSLITYKLVQKYYKDLADEEIESVKDLYKEKIIKHMETQSNTKESNLDFIGSKGQNGDPKGEIIKNQEIMEKIINDSNYNVGIDEAKDGTESQQVEEIIEQEESLGNDDYTVPVEVEDEDPSIPYIITEDEFGEFGNEEQSLIYYSDFVLTDEQDEVITDHESVIGDALKEFNEDPLLERVYVRDENKEIDYIILRSEKSYSEVYGEEE